LIGAFSSTSLTLLLEKSFADGIANGLSNITISVIGGVLVDHCRLNGRLTEAAHGLLDRGADLGGQRAVGVSQVVEVEVGQADGLSGVGPFLMPDRPAELVPPSRP
jgi:hypothetical protein